VPAALFTSMLEEFAGGVEPADDQTLLVLRVR